MLRLAKCLALGALLGLVPAVHAAPVIANLLQPQSYSLLQLPEGIVVGDKLFSDFAVASIGVDAPGPGDIAVTGSVIDGDYGLYFQGFWAVDVGERVDTVLSFKVTVMAPNAIIELASLKMTAVGAYGGGLVSITENIYDAPPSGSSPSVADLSTLYNSSGTKRLFASTELSSAAREVWVVKDIGLAGRTGDAQLSQFYQSFGQHVPEPASLAIFALGGVLVVRRRKA